MASDYTLADLRYFRAAARAGSFLLGARVVHVSPPAMSKAIARLEAALEVRLFDRTSRKVALTDAGRLFLARAETILAEADAAAGEVVRGGRALSGELRVGAMEVFSVAVLPRAVAALLRAHPALLVRSFEGSPARIDAWVERGEVDLGFAIGPPTRGSLGTVALGTSRGVIVCGRAHPFFRARHVSLAALLAEPFVVPSFLGEEGAPPIDQFPAHLVRRTGATIELLQMGIALALEGACLGYFPEISVREPIARRALRAFAVRGATPFELRASFRRADERRATVLAAIDEVRAALVRR